MPRLRTLSLVTIMVVCVLGNRRCESNSEPEAPGGGTAAGAGGSTGAAGKGGGGPVAGTPDAGSGKDAGALRACGTRGGIECAGDEFCLFAPDADCGATDRGGRCEEKPDVCATVDEPVCGCDRRSYSNPCDAHRAGVSVAHEGLCTVRECEMSGGRPAYSDGASTPVCRAGEDSWSIGGTDEPALCCVPAPQGETCGGIAALQCGSGEFCNYETAAGGQGCDGSIADAAGVCTERPTRCTREYRPVCGCDYRTYATACTAHADGVSVLHDGACTELDCKAAGGRAVDGIGPPAMCDDDEVSFGPIMYSNGMIAIEGTLCCVPR